MNGLLTVLLFIGGLAFIAVLAWSSLAGIDLMWRRAIARRDRLRAEIELQRLTHKAVLHMLAVAREHRHTE